MNRGQFGELSLEIAGEKRRKRPPVSRVNRIFHRRRRSRNQLVE